MRFVLLQSFSLGIGLSLCSALCAAAEPTSKAKDALLRQSPRNVAIFVFQGMELLDFAGPGEVFQAAGPKFKVYSVAESTEPIVSQGFVKIVPQYSIQDCPRPDLLVIPGGNTSAALKNPEVIAWVKRVSGEAEVTMSVCTGAFILAKAGILDGREATTHWFHLTRLGKSASNIQVRSNVRFVDTGKVVTTAGVSAGIDGALHVVDRLLGHKEAARIAKGMEYRWDEARAPEDAATKEDVRPKQD
jgi:transcriptional regulator GlxA family with amidase domain